MKLWTVVAISMIFGPLVPSADASDGWQNGRKLKQSIRKQKRAGSLPISITCRDYLKPGSRVSQPHAKVGWAKNTAKKSWQIFFSRVQSRQDIVDKAKRRTGLRLVSRKTIVAGPSRSRWTCEIWHGNN